MKDEILAWSKLLRDNFPVLLLVLIYGTIFFTVLHMSHDGRDADNVGWVREAAGAVAGCLFGFLKGKESGRTEPQSPIKPNAG